MTVYALLGVRLQAPGVLKIVHHIGGLDLIQLAGGVLLAAGQTVGVLLQAVLLVEHLAAAQAVVVLLQAVLLVEHLAAEQAVAVLLQVVLLIEHLVAGQAIGVLLMAALGC